MFTRLLVLVAFLTLSLQCYSATVITNITDTHGNIAYSNGTIVWVADIPVGNATYVTSNEYDDGGLSFIFALSRNFINTVQPNDFPYDVLKKVMNGTFDIGKDYMDLIDYSMGFAVCFAIGMLFAILLPLCGCCICCCRCCCGNCGGDLKAVYNENEDCKRMGIAQALFLMLIVMAVSAGCVWMTNGRFTTSIEYTDKTIASNIDDIQIFVNNLVAQFEYMSIDMYKLIQGAIVNDIGDLGGVLETAIFTNLKITDVIDAVTGLDTTLRNISTALTQFITEKDTLVAAANNLTTSMNNLGDDIDVTKTTCSTSGAACQTACDNMDTAPLKAGSVDFSSLPDLSSVQTNVDNVVAMNLSGIAQSASSKIDDVSVVINNATDAMKAVVNGTMNTFGATISNMTNELFGKLNTSINLQPLKADLSDFFTMVQKYDNYRFLFGYALTGLFTVIVAISLLGVCCGCVGQDSDKLPTERSFMSNCGGCLLIIPVLVMFLVGSLLMLLTTLTFAIGGNLEKLCQPMLDLSIFTDFVDDGGLPGMSLGEIMFANSSHDLRYYDLLLGCRANKAPFKLLGLDNLLPLEEYLNHTQYTSTLTSDLSGATSIDLTSFSILTTDMETALTDLQSSGLNSINFTAIDSTLSQSLVSVDFSATITAMEAIRDSCSTPASTRWDGHITSMQHIQTVDLVAVQTAQTDLISSMAVLQGLISGLDAHINNTLEVARNADDQLKNNVTAVLTQAVDDFANRIINYVDQYGNQSLYIVYNEIARCLPIWNMYESFTSVLCLYMVESMNAFWFGTGLGLLFFIPVMVFSMKLSKYYRRMKEQVGYKEDVEPEDEDIDDFSVRYDMMKRHRQVAPDPDYMD